MKNKLSLLVLICSFTLNSAWGSDVKYTSTDSNVPRTAEIIKAEMAANTADRNKIADLLEELASLSETAPIKILYLSIRMRSLGESYTDRADNLEAVARALKGN